MRPRPADQPVQAKSADIAETTAAAVNPEVTQEGTQSAENIVETAVQVSAETASAENIPAESVEAPAVQASATETPVAATEENK